MKLIKPSDMEFVKSSGIIGIGNIVSRCLGFVFLILIARLFSEEDFGFIKYSITVATLVSVVVISGFPIALTRFIGKYIKNKNQLNIYLTNAIIGIIVLLFLTLLVILSFSFLFGKEVFGVAIVIIGLTINFTYFGIIRGFLLSKKIALYKIISNSIKIMLIILLIHFFDIKSTFLVLAIFALSYSCFIPIEFLHKTKISFNYKLKSRKKFKDIAKFAFPLIIATIAYNVIFSIDIILIGYYHNMTEVGIYSIAKILVSVFFFVPAAIATILMPKISSLKKFEQNHYLKLSLFLALLASIGLLIFYLIFGEQLILKIFESKYLDAKKPLFILVFGGFFYSLYMILESLWVGIGRPGIHTKTLIISMFINIICNFLLIPEYGLSGASIGFTISTGCALGILGFSTLTYIRKQKINARKDL